MSKLFLFVKFDNWFDLHSVKHQLFGIFSISLGQHIWSLIVEKWIFFATVGAHILLRLQLFHHFDCLVLGLHRIVRVILDSQSSLLH